MSEGQNREREQVRQFGPLNDKVNNDEQNTLIILREFTNGDSRDKSCYGIKYVGKYNTNLCQSGGRLDSSKTGRVERRKGPIL